MEKAREAAHTQEERELLDQLEQVQRHYAERRREVVRLFDAGQREQARRMLLSDVVDLYQEAFDLCEDFMAANAAYVAATTDRMRRQVNLLSAGITGCVIANCVWGGLDLDVVQRHLVSLTTHGRRRSQLFRRTAIHDGTLDSDELRDVGRHMRLLVAHEQLKQVFMNLLTNSMETMPEGGSIRLDCATGELHGQSMVVVRVTDQGAGMTSDVQSRVFEPFFTTKDSGTGLGLCIAASIMARHDGALMLENTTSAGTVFAVWIPTWEDSDRE